MEKRLKERDVQLDITDNVIKKLAELGYVKEFGARPLKRTIQQYVTLPVSKYLIENPEIKAVKVEMKKDKITIQ